MCATRVGISRRSERARHAAAPPIMFDERGVASCVKATEVSISLRSGRARHAAAPPTMFDERGVASCVKATFSSRPWAFQPTRQQRHVQRWLVSPAAVSMQGTSPPRRQQMFGERGIASRVECQLSSRQRALKPERRQVCLECEVSLNSSRASFEAAQGLFSPSAGAPAQLSATKPGMALSHFEDRHDSEPPHGDEPQYLFLFGRLTRALSLSHASPVRTFHPLPRASVIGASALSLPALLTNGRCQVRQQAAPKPRNRSWL